MTLDLPTLLIIVVFASQILVCSFISAWRFGKSARQLRMNYPPAEYPALYPIAPEKMRRLHDLRMAVRLAIGIAGVAVLVAGVLNGVGPARLATHMLWVAMAQLLLILIFLPQQLSMTRALRAMPAPAVRSADLRQWRLGDFVSPALIALGFMAVALSITCAGWLYFQNPSQNLRIHLYCGAVSILLLARMLYLLLRPVVMARPDPYMSAEDVFRNRQQRLRLLFRMAFVLGLYFTFMEIYAAGQLRFEYFYVAAGVSVLVQLLSLRMMQMVQSAINERDLAPYRANPAKEQA